MECKKKRITLYDNKFIIGKSNPKSSCFDTLIFSVRSIEHAIIPSFIKRIYSNAFYRCENLQKVTFEKESKLKFIDEYSFSLTQLKSILISSSVIEIGRYAFEYCPLENLEFEKDSKLKYINQNAFANSNLVNIKIPPNVKIIGSFAFNYCKNLQKVEFCENSKIEIIENSAFCCCGFVIINIPRSVKEIKSYAFSSCEYLESVTFLEKSQITKIGNIFAESSLKSFTIPSSVEFLDEKWSYNPNLIEVKVDPANKHFINYDTSFILGKSSQENEGFDVLVFANKKIKKASIPSCVKEIASYASFYCKSLEIVEFPTNSQLKTIGKYTFRNSSIRRISLPSKLVEIGVGAFIKCENLEAITFSEYSELKYIRNSAFYGTSIKTFNVPSNVERIESNAFSSCKQLQKVELSEQSKIELFEDILFECSAITTLDIPPKIKEIKPECFLCANNLKYIIISPQKKNFIFYEDNFLIGKSDFHDEIYDVLCFTRCDIEEAIVPSFVTEIGQYSFMNCSKLRKIEFLKSSKLKCISSYAFIGNKFESISIPQHVIEIKPYAFN